MGNCNSRKNQEKLRQQILIEEEKKKTEAYKATKNKLEKELNNLNTELERRKQDPTYERINDGTKYDYTPLKINEDGSIAK